MDVLTKPKNTKLALLKSKRFYVVSLATMFTAILWLQSSADVSVPKSAMNIKTVQRGDLPLVINAYGKLASHDTRLLTAPVAATVERILLKPGAQVTKNTVILELGNPELNQKVEAAQLGVYRAETNYEKLAIELQDKRLQQQSTIALLESELKSAKLKYNAEKKLESSGIISKLQIQTSAIKVDQLEVRLDIAKQRIEHLVTINQSRLAVENELVKLAKSQLKLHQNNQQALQVRAGIDGVLQRLPIELGENVIAGENLAIVGSVSSLIAQLKIPQSQAADVSMGNQVSLTVANQQVAAKVSRIDPVVTDGYVTIEAAISQQLPAGARPEINVQGFVTASTIQDTLYVELPANIAGNTSANMFVVDDEQQLATVASVKFGRVAGRYIEVVDGVKAHERIVVSDVDQWRDYKQIVLLN